MNKKHNILLLMTDEQRFDAVGFSNQSVKTPNLDKLTRESIVFTHAYTSNPSCIPARASIYTGKYPTQCHCPTYTSFLPQDEVTFMSLLQKSGYYTAVVGKQHFAESDIDKGYDFEDLIDGHNATNFNEPVNKDISSYMNYLKSSGFKDQNELFEKENVHLTYKWLADTKYHIDYFTGQKGIKCMTDIIPAKQPWFLCISFPGPHQPYDCNGTEYADMYQLDDIDVPSTKEEHLHDKPPHYLRKKGNNNVNVATGIDEENIRNIRRSYYANVSLIDRMIGDILKTLADMGEYDNTVIIFTSDHGDFMGDFGMITKGQYLSEVLMRVPFLIKPPIAGFEGIFEGIFVNDLVTTVDIAATCLSIAGAEIPKEMTSHDLSVYWRSPESVTERESIFMEAGAIKGVRTKEWKLVYYTERQYGELYNMNEDPWETHNLWNDDLLVGIKDNLKSLLLNHIIQSDPLWDKEWAKNAPKI